MVQQFWKMHAREALRKRRSTLLSVGRLRFWKQMQSGGRRRPAPFVRTASDKDRSCVDNREQAEAVVRWLVNESGLAAPRVLLSITGGAQTLHLPGGVQQLFERGLVRAARTQGTWILTGGTSSGVMKLVGDAVSVSCLSACLRPWIA